MYRTIGLHFPELSGWMREVDDCRNKASDYELAAHLTACLAMFLFKAGSLATMRLSILFDGQFSS
ncbi:MAG: hypothetical protein NTX45_22150 [Proteobacteria bacterium]|nr:hypothetical protein [Pseudomonadota bacterium]